MDTKLLACVYHGEESDFVAVLPLSPVLRAWLADARALFLQNASLAGARLVWLTYENISCRFYEVGDEESLGAAVRGAYGVDELCDADDAAGWVEIDGVVDLPEKEIRNSFTHLKVCEDMTVFTAYAWYTDDLIETANLDEYLAKESAPCPPI